MVDKAIRGADLDGDGIYDKTGLLDQLGEISDQKKEEILSLITSANWDSQESLLGLQLDLEKLGYDQSTAQTFTKLLGDVSFASSGLEITVKSFDDLWKATEKINDSMKKLTQLQWEYNRENTSGNVYGSYIREFKRLYGDIEPFYVKNAELLEDEVIEGLSCLMETTIDMKRFYEYKELTMKLCREIANLKLRDEIRTSNEDCCI